MSQPAETASPQLQRRLGDRRRRRHRAGLDDRRRACSPRSPRPPARPAPGCWSRWRWPRWWPTATPPRRPGWPRATRRPAAPTSTAASASATFWGYLAGWALRGRQDRLLRGDGADLRRVRAARSRRTPVAVAAVVALTAVNYAGVQKSVWLTRVIVAVVLAVLAGGRGGRPHRVGGGHRPAGRRRRRRRHRRAAGAPGLLFFAFAGYARIATLGEEVRDPGAHHPPGDPARARHRPWSCTRPWPSPSCRCSARTRLAAAAAPLADAVAAAGAGWLAPGRAGRGGRRRARLAARPDPGRLPHHPGDGPRPAPARRPGRRASALPGAAPRRAGRSAPSSRCSPPPSTCAARSASRRSACCVYYAVANASAWTLTPDENRPPRLVPAVGLAGCLLLAFTLPADSVAWGTIVLAAGIAAYGIRRAISARRAS